jgi:transforming growth factor-beta-induced protein
MKPLFFTILSIMLSFQIKAQTVVDIIVNSPNHNTLETAVLAAGLADDLSAPGPFTVFAPTDAAFAALPPSLLNDLLADPNGALTDVLLYHVVSGQALSTSLSDGQVITTLLGQDVTVTINMDGVFINDAEVTNADILATNGVVHVIDAVLVPELDEPLPATVVDIVVNSPVHTTLETAVIAAGLADDLSGAGPFTVFAPTDAAFASLPTGLLDALLADPTGDLASVLLYHVVAGQALSSSLSDGQVIETLLGQDVTITIDANGVFVNDAEVIIADLLAENGVVHVIDAVLVPELGEPLPATVVDIVVNSPVHTTLETAVIAAGLADDLSGVGPFTVFAPTDAAFAALPTGLLDALLADPTGDLASVLLYHVVAGQALSTSLSDGQVIETLLGQDVTITIDANGVFVNDAEVIIADLLAQNGVVHVIDAVLVPELGEPLPATVVDIVVNSPVHTTLETAVIAAGLADDLSGAGPFTVFAPTDAAFAALPTGLLDALLADPTGDLASVLLYHVVAGQALSTSLSDGQVIETLLGQDITITIDANGVFVNDAEVIIADLLAENGVVHVIDAVLVPELGEPLPATVVDIVVNSPVHTTLETAVIAAGLADDLSGTGPFTVFAPTDAAFAALPAGVLDGLLSDPTGALAEVLLYHVVAGQALSTSLADGQMIETLFGEDVTVTINANGVFINDAEVIIADLLAENGVVHVIDAVLIPTVLPMTVVDIIVGSPIHTTLETAVIAAGLADDLSGDGPFTVFAPTDAAFTALPAGVLDALLADPTGALADVLLYHVVSGQSLSTDLSNGQVIPTLLGQNVTISINANGVFVNNAQVIVADLQAENGVVHVIDAVLTPTVSVDEMESITANVFPNPATEFINVVIESNQNNAFYQVYDMSGSIVKQGLLNTVVNTIEVNDLSGGLYQIRVVSNERSAIVPFIRK